MSERDSSVFAYHEATKHHFDRYARGPGYLDWASQPDPFRRYDGAPVIALEKVAPVVDPPYDAVWAQGAIPPAPLNRHTLSQLFLDSLALSAWKRAGSALNGGYMALSTVPGISGPAMKTVTAWSLMAAPFPHPGR